MKISISLPEEDLVFLDGETVSGVFESRSAAVHAAVRLLRESRLADAYVQAFSEWEDSGDVAWDSTASDGLNADGIAGSAS